MIPCGDMHQSFTVTTAVKWFLDNLHMFADDFRVLSIHRVARRLGASFRYQCPASRGSCLRQHGFFVAGITTVPDRQIDRQTTLLSL